MNLVKAPLRISYVGGGTDYPEFYMHNEGAGVIAAAIDRYVYVYSHPLSEIAEENIRFTYRETESVSEIDEIRHPVMREMLREVSWSSRTNFGTFADLPSGVGLGGSSSFAVALATLIFLNRNLPHDPHTLARLAIRIEREILGEAGGIQDQYVAAFGGLRKYSFSNESVSVSDVLLDSLNLAFLEERQLLIWLGESRNSAVHAEHTRLAINKSHSVLKETSNLFDITEKAISRSSSPTETFNALREGVRLGWDLKKKFTTALHHAVAEIELSARAFPEVGMKLCGAGGTGFVLILAEPETLIELMKSMPHFKYIKPRIDVQGSRLVRE
jgi:D-glycero-alpha-D-manno-heptose-7-phosphate kinase